MSWLKADDAARRRSLQKLLDEPFLETLRTFTETIRADSIWSWPLFGLPQLGDWHNGVVQCLKCGHRWNATWPVEASVLQCPVCLGRIGIRDTN